MLMSCDEFSKNVVGDSIVAACVRAVAAYSHRGQAGLAGGLSDPDGGDLGRDVFAVGLVAFDGGLHVRLLREQLYRAGYDLATGRLRVERGKGNFFFLDFFLRWGFFIFKLLFKILKLRPLLVSWFSIELEFHFFSRCEKTFQRWRFSVGVFNCTGFRPGAGTGVRVCGV